MNGWLQPLSCPYLGARRSAASQQCRTGQESLDLTLRSFQTKHLFKPIRRYLGGHPPLLLSDNIELFIKNQGEEVKARPDLESTVFPCGHPLCLPWKIRLSCCGRALLMQSKTILQLIKRQALPFSASWQSGSVSLLFQTACQSAAVTAELCLTSS